MPRTTRDVLPAGCLRNRSQPRIPARSGLELRPWHDTDRDVLVRAFADPDIRRWHLRTLPTAEDAQEWVRGKGEDWDGERGGSWAVAASGDSVVGQVALRGTNLAMGVTQISYWVLPGSRGRGVATTAVRALTSWSFDEVGFHRLWLMHSVANRPSCAVATNAGYESEGTLREALLHDDGWHDMHVHGRIIERSAPR